MGVALGQAFPGVTSAEGFAAIALRQMGEDCRVTPNDTACYDAAALLHAEERGGADMSAVQRYAATACNRKAYPGCLPVARSEEHTSELQSLMSISYAVF